MNKLKVSYHYNPANAHLTTFQNTVICAGQDVTKMSPNKDLILMRYKHVQV